jgi:hypothetical protein
LSSRQDVEPFEDFVQVGGGLDEQGNVSLSVTGISEAWKDLQNRRELVVEWQDERDAIEGEAASFEVGDMERLRKVAKGE